MSKKMIEAYEQGLQSRKQGALSERPAFSFLYY